VNNISENSEYLRVWVTKLQKLNYNGMTATELVILTDALNL